MDDVEIGMPGDEVRASQGAPARKLRLTLKMCEFSLPPIRDGAVIGRRAAIGPRALFDAVDRMLPGMYELIVVDDHAVIEAIIVRKDRVRLLDRARLLDVFIRHAESLMTDTSIVQVEVDGELSVRMDLEL